MATFHVEMRSFPKSLTRFNQSGEELGAIVLAWVQDKIVELDGEKWAPWESTIAIVEGPPIPLSGLSMGRGWRTAQREGTDVTDRVLAEARKAIADGSAFAEPPPAAGSLGAGSPDGRPPDAGPQVVPFDGGVTAAQRSAALAASTGYVELDMVLGSEPSKLFDAWHEVADRTAGLTPSECLALAERELQRRERRPE